MAETTQEQQQQYIRSESRCSTDSSNSSNYRNISDLSIPMDRIPEKYLHANIKSRIGIDIGGTLAKLVYYDDDSEKLEFKFVGTTEIEEFIGLIDSIISQKLKILGHGSFGKSDRSDIEIHATGGGSYKFYEILSKKFQNITIKRKDEIHCAIFGLTFLINYNDKLEESDCKKLEIFRYNDIEGKRYSTIESEKKGTTTTNPTDLNNNNSKSKNSNILLVNIGSGVSIIKVNRETNEYERVGGSSLGGGTLWGLLSLMTGAETYDEMLELSMGGDNTKVDMLVGDIYGTAYDNIGLKSTHIASSMGKAFQKNSDKSPNFNNSDICKSMLYAVSNNIGQISYLQSKIHDIDTIFFGGSYIRGHFVTMNTLDFAINFWSKGASKGYFLEHEAYLGALGSIFI